MNEGAAPRRSHRVLLVSVLVAAVLAVAVTVTIIATRGGSSPAAAPAARRDVTIGASGGITLAAQVWTPADNATSPLVVMPIPFGSPGTVYDKVAAKLRVRGYVVVTYLQRGFHESGGNVDIAGTPTQGDVSTVITWALANTPADADHVGMMAESYGAGMSLLAASRDARIKAVVAMSAWADLDAAFDPNHTASTTAVQSLLDQVGDRLATSVQPFAASVGTASFGSELAKIAPVRSPQSFVGALNHNNPAIMLANGFGDSYFPPRQLVRFYNALSTPKRLQLAPGDHGGPEYSGLQGQQNAVISSGFAWLDHFLRGLGNGVLKQGPVLLTDETSSDVHTYPSWPTSELATPLGAPGSLGDVGSPSAWTAQLIAGHDSGANSATQHLGSSGDSTQADTGTFDADSALVWSGAPLTANQLLSGTPALHLRVASTTTTATLFVQLYEADPSGAATLMSAQPYTATGLTPGHVRSISIDLQPVSWTATAGNRLVLAIDTADPGFTSPTPDGTGIVVSSTLADPATVSLPMP